MNRKRPKQTQPVNIYIELHDWLRKLSFDTDMPMRDLTSKMIEHFKCNELACKQLLEQLIKGNKK